MQPNFTLRPIAPTDGPAFAALSDSSSDAGKVSFRGQFQIEPYRALMALHPNLVGVVAEQPGVEEIIGVGLVDFGECAYEGEVLPYALLNTLAVHPDHRRKGVAAALAQWRVDIARQRFGDEGLLMANIQGGNDGSIANARKWCNQLIGPGTAIPMPMRRRPPQKHPTVRVRPATETDLAAIADHTNTFYQDYNFHRRLTPEHLADWLKETPFDTPYHHTIVAEDAAGNLLAGLGLTEEARVMSMKVIKMPALMKFVAHRAGLIPPDNISRQIDINQFWYRPGQEEAAHYLWETVRWEWRGFGSLLFMFIDARSPFPKILRTPFWLPKSEGMIAVHAPKQANTERLFYMSR